MNVVSLSNVCKSFNGKPILKDINLDIEKGAFISIFGPNAVGKTTLLNIISGLLIADSGLITWDSEASRNKVSYVFQNYRETLFPWQRIWENISLPLKLKGVNKTDCKERAMELIRRFKISIDPEKYPYELSGGQQQLVAILRAVITDPVLLLLDEPFSALDFARRLELQQKILDIWHEIRSTVIFISHDLDEAILMGDEVVLLGSMPTRIKEVLKINIDRPRSSDHLVNDKFVTYKKQLLDGFMGKQPL